MPKVYHHRNHDAPNGSIYIGGDQHWTGWHRLSELRGKNLLCDCELPDSKCPAQKLLRLANEDELG